MRIKNIELSNFQGITEFKSNFEGGVYFIKGENELGKSTLLKSIGILLTGDRDAVLKNGEDKGFVKMVVGDDGENYEVELKMTKNNPRGSLSITSTSNGLKTDRISFLQNIFNYKDFDAVEFSRWSDTAEGRRKQVSVIKSLLPKESQIRLSEINTEVEVLKNNRKDLKSDYKSLEKEVKIKYEKVSPNLTPSSELQEVNVQELINEQESIIKASSMINKVNSVISDGQEVLDNHDSELKSLKEKRDGEISELSKELEALILSFEAKKEKVVENYNSTKLNMINQKNEVEERLVKAKDWLVNNPDRSGRLESIKNDLLNAQEINSLRLNMVDYEKLIDDFSNKEGELGKLENDIKILLSEKDNIINNSPIPIKGLSFSDDGLELNGVPFVSGKVSDSQIMEVAVKLIIASNENVKVFRIARGESLGTERLKDIIKVANDNGYQGFIEEVQRGQDELIVEKYSEKQ